MFSRITNNWKYLAALAGISIIVAYNWGPSNYDECLVDALKETPTNAVASAQGLFAASAMGGCRLKFPLEPRHKNKAKPLSAEELRLLSGRGAPKGDKFLATLYNGNARLAIAQVDISIVAALENNETETKTYRSDVYIPPLKTTEIELDIMSLEPNAMSTWNIKGAKGYLESE